MTSTEISWTDVTWNPTTGCDRVSPGCDNCYALTMARRLKGMGSAKYQRDGDPKTSGPGFGITEHESSIDAPLSWRKPRKVFVNSMSDLFHDRVSDEFIARVFAVMARTPQHTYQLLTKRHGRMRSLLGMDGQTLLEATRDEATAQALYDAGWPLPNVWLGVSVEDQKRANLRIPALLQTPAAVRFLSCEPLLGPVDLVAAVNKLDWLDQANWKPGGIDWVIVGGESGQGARPMHPDWARDLRDQCQRSEVAFHFKQWGAWTSDEIPGRPDVLIDRDGNGRPWAHRNRDGIARLWHAKGKHDTGRELDARTWDEYPVVAS